MESRAAETTEGTTDETNTASEKKFVATLTVKDWASIDTDGTYQFNINHRTNEDGKRCV